MKLTIALLVSALLVFGCAQTPSHPSATASASVEDHSGHNHGPGEGHGQAAEDHSGHNHEPGEGHGEAAEDHSSHDHASETPNSVPALAEVPEGARVSFVTPIDGSEVGSPIKVEFQVEGMEVKPAGDMTENSGHHHLIIDGDPVEAGVVVPADEKHVHFGKGQTETEVTLEPGKHTLTMQFADFAHRSYGPRMSSTVTITVK